MIKVIIAAAFALCLASCKEDIERRAREKTFIESNLPAGCEFRYLGDYGPSRVNVIICRGRGTTTTNTHRSQQSGKVTNNYYDTTVIIDDE